MALLMAKMPVIVVMGSPWQLPAFEWGPVTALGEEKLQSRFD